MAQIDADTERCGKCNSGTFSTSGEVSINRSVITLIVNSVATVLTVLITLLFPLLIWLSHGKIEPRWLAGLLLLTAATRLITFKKNKLARRAMVMLLILAAIVIGSNALLPLKLYPVLVSLVLLIAFSATLFSPPSIVERFARISEPNLPPIAVAYTRRVTQIWCVFFIVNSVIAFITAVWATEDVWLLYTGVISYVLMGTLFSTEFLYRKRFKRLNHV